MKNRTYTTRAFRACSLAVLAGLAVGVVTGLGAEPAGLFVPSSSCQACHNNVRDGSGNDISMGVQWRASVMAHSAVDPYWLASVRRETHDHPTAVAAIEDKCATCHMPMARMTAIHTGSKGVVLAHRPDAHGKVAAPLGPLAADGVSCSVCHQITPKNLGKPASFTGNFHVDPKARQVYGPYDIEKGITRIMESASGYTPKKAAHIREAALCGSCHTLYTHALDAAGNDAGELPEQMPYLEWVNSGYADVMSCQDCHMPEVKGEVPVSSVLGVKRPNVRKHQFRGGNMLLLAMLGTYGDELGARAAPSELESSRRATMRHLREASASLTLDARVARDGRAMLETTVAVANRAGHKLPTAYPSRRVWLHVTVKGNGGETLFESGALAEDGSIVGNANDRDGAAFEPHYTVVSEADQVQIYEAILGTPDGAVTTGLLKANRYLKDNRIVPTGFDKQGAGRDIAVVGAAREDADFADGKDTVTYRVPLATQASVKVTAELLYQPIGHRWAMNLDDYDGVEPKQFVRMYKSMAAPDKAIVLARKEMTVTIPAAP